MISHLLLHVLQEMSILLNVVYLDLVVGMNNTDRSLLSTELRLHLGREVLVDELL